MAELKNLGFISSLDYKKLMEMSDDEKEKFVINDIKETFSRRTETDMCGPIIPITDTSVYSVSAGYTVIDSRLNIKGHLYAHFTVKRIERKLSVTLNTIKYKQEDK